ncbi:Uncharacterized protein (Fragment) [Durusdinium trenchii]|uniref:Uncharacterized protein n=1 Tax=Durusdinium trenchii TaxID=1381693 RepID=A0ABP0I2S3_9DINO
MQGPCASLRSAGCSGKYASNVHRDIMRKVIKNDPNQVVIDWIEVPVQKQYGPNGVEMRKHPVVLPHKLVCEPCWPRIDPADVETYWQNLESHQSPLASISPDHSHIPLWIWGDECQFRENGDELLLICIGCVVDARKFSVEVCYPLALCRSELKAGFTTVQGILQVVLESLMILYNEGAGVGEELRKYAITEIRGPLLDLPSFTVNMIRWDGMHIINLGADLWVVGSLVRKLMSYDVFGGFDMEESDRLLIAYDLFRAWARTNKVQCFYYNLN